MNNETAAAIRTVQEGLDTLSRLLDRSKAIPLAMARGAFSTLTKALGPLSESQTVDGNERLEKVVTLPATATTAEREFMGLMKRSILNPVETIAGARH
jgi:hypothetical protein